MSPKRVLCIGDSLTWGWIPVAGGMPTEQRWTGVLADQLGAGCTVIEQNNRDLGTALSEQVAQLLAWAPRPVAVWRGRMGHT